MPLRSLPLFHRIAGQPVIVLGMGPAAEPKRRLVQRAGGLVIDDLAQGIDHGARLAFIAHDDAAMCESDALRARGAGLLVNVVDRPELCDFTTPSILDRDPVLIAVGTSGASAGLAKQLRLRLEALLPAGLGDLASALAAGRERLREVFPDGAQRRRALDGAMSAGGPLDPLAADGGDAVEKWLENPDAGQGAGLFELTLRSDDPEDLTLREARLLGTADWVVHDADIPPAVLDRARADAQRALFAESQPGTLPGTVVVIRRP